MEIISANALTFFVAIIYASFGEWLIHTFLMHRRMPLLSYPFEKHQLQHHVLFRGDETYQACPPDERLEHITFTPFDYLLITFFHTGPLCIISVLLGRNIVFGGLLAIFLYTLMFDFIHWYFHVPSGRFFEKFRIFQWLRRHHKIHHHDNSVNKNVVFPLADLVLGTLRTRWKY